MPTRPPASSPPRTPQDPRTLNRWRGGAPRLLTVPEVAARIDLSPRCVRRLIDAGRLTAELRIRYVKVAGRTLWRRAWWVHSDSVDAELARRLEETRTLGHVVPPATRVHPAVEPARRSRPAKRRKTVRPVRPVRPVGRVEKRTGLHHAPPVAPVLPVPSPRRPPGTYPYRIDEARAWEAAKARVRGWGEPDPDHEVRHESNPVQKAKRLAEVTAPADMRLSIALSHGITGEQAEANKAWTRAALEGAHRRLGIVGLRAGDSLEEGMSDRMARFMDAFFGEAAERAAAGRVPSARGPGGAGPGPGRRGG